MSWQTRQRHFRLARGELPGLAASTAQRRLLREMRILCRRLPALLTQPLPAALQALEEVPIAGALPDEAGTRRLADLAALLERRSPLGICLRRSLVRYRYLRALEVPVVIRFGAQLRGSAEERNIGGHAWLELGERP